MAIINSSNANETLTGAVEDDIYVFSNGFGSDSIIDLGGIDSVDLSALTSRLTINLGTGGVGDEILTGGNDNVNWIDNLIENAIGGSNKDVITGSRSNNFISGRGGDDKINGGAGDDSLDGGAGDDIYYFSGAWGKDLITGDSSGIDALNFSLISLNLTINLSSGGEDEVTDGTNSLNWETIGDVIESVNSGSGNDSITGNSSYNRLMGGPGNDTLNGKAGNDTLDGNIGDDTYVFSAGWGVENILDSSGTDDTVNLSAIIDNLTINLTSGNGNEISDEINKVNWSSGVIENACGGEGDDTISGNASDNYLAGGAGNDTLNGRGGNDTLDGGEGDDLYKFQGRWDSDYIEGELQGRDSLDFSVISSNLTVNLNSSGLENEVTAGSGNTLNWTGNLIENVTGGSGNDLIIGSAAANYIIGGRGDDTLDGGVGSDSYEFSGTWGVDSIKDAAGAIDHIILGAVAANLTINLIASDSKDEVTDGTNSINWSADEVIEKLLSGSGNDIIIGNGSNNVFEAGLGNDIINGDSGNDIYVFSNNWGLDYIIDTAGTNDSISLKGVAANLVINLSTNGEGNEVSDGTNSINWLSNVIEHAYGGSGNDSIIGSSAKNLINGSSGNDTLSGESGNDTYEFLTGWGTDNIIDTEGGDDSVLLSRVTTAMTINLVSSSENNEVTDGTSSINWSGNVIEKAYGGFQGDLIYGNSDYNFLNGGSGDDTLYGGSGDDIYVFQLSDGHDIINDNSGLDDKLSLRAYTVGSALFIAQDSNSDGKIDDLFIDFGGTASVIIKNYFDNSSIDDDLSSHGAGEIETLVFSDDTSVDFNQIQAIIP